MNASDDEADERCNDALELVEKVCVHALDVAPRERDVETRAHLAGRPERTSVPLNLREGSGSFGGHRKQRYHTALGSSGEVLACYDTAEAINYIDPVGSEARDRVDHVIGTLVNVLRLRR